MGLCPVHCEWVFGSGWIVAQKNWALDERDLLGKNPAISGSLFGSSCRGWPCFSTLCLRISIPYMASGRRPFIKQFFSFFPDKNRLLFDALSCQNAPF